MDVDGIMSYKAVRTTWSTCSKEAIHGWFDQLSRYKINCKEDEEPPVDCAWGEWSEYSSCSVSCDGDGTRTRHRSKAVEAANGGFDCAGPTEDTETCNNGPCGPPCDDMNPAFCNNYKGQYWFNQWCFINQAHSFFSGYSLMQYFQKGCGGC